MLEGTNDNLSGAVTALTLARYFHDHRPEEYLNYGLLPLKMKKWANEVQPIL